VAATWDELQATLYKSYNCDNNYRLVEGVVALPVAEEPDADDPAWSPVVLVRLHAPYRVRTVSVAATKSNTPPMLPKPGDAGAFAYLGSEFSIPTPSINADQRNFDWAAGATYTYVETVKPNATDGFVLGMTPWTWVTQLDNASVYGLATLATGSIENAGRVTAGAYGATGAAADAGLDVATGVLQAGGVDFGSPTYVYSTPSFYPSSFLNADIVNGGPVPEED
jgi:hypothetical protein